MKIGVLGSGLMGGKLGTIFARAGHEVVFSYSRDRSRLEALAKDAGKSARAGAPAEAASGADVVLVAVHWTRVDDVLAQAGALSGKTVITCSLPMSGDDSRLVVGGTSSGAEEFAKKTPGAHVVAAFNTVPSEVLFSVFEQKGRGTPLDLVYCGDDEAAKQVVAGLIRDVGFNPRDVGGLDAARLTEPFALVIAELAYNGPDGPEMGYRFGPA